MLPRDLPHLDTLLGRLSAVVETYRSGDRPQSWTAACPCSTHRSEPHDLEIGLDPDDKIILLCQAGCSLDDMLRSLSLRRSDLRPPFDEADLNLLALPESHEVDSTSVQGVPSAEDERPEKTSSSTRSTLPASSALLHAGEVRAAVQTQSPILLLETPDQVSLFRRFLGEESSRSGREAELKITPCPTSPPRGLSGWQAKHRDALCGAQVWLGVVELQREDPLVSQICSDLSGIVSSLKIVRLSERNWKFRIGQARPANIAKALITLFEAAPFYYRHAVTNEMQGHNHARGASEEGAHSSGPSSDPGSDPRGVSPDEPAPINSPPAGMHRLRTLVAWLVENGAAVHRLSDGLQYLILSASVTSRKASARASAESQQRRPRPVDGLFHAFLLSDPLAYSSVAPAFFRDRGELISSSAFRDACLLLAAGIRSDRVGSGDIESLENESFENEGSGETSKNGLPSVVARRIGFQNGTFYLDLADEQDRVVSVGSTGWQYARRCPIAFIRTSEMLPLPCPTGGGALELLRDLLGLSPGSTWTAVRAWLVGTLLPYGPVPPLLLQEPLLQEKDTVRTRHLSHLLSYILDPHVPDRTPAAESLSRASVFSYARPFIACADLYEGSYAHLAVLDELGRLDAPGSGRMILTDRSRPGFASELRRRCLVLEPEFAPRAGPRSPLASQIDSAHAAILEALLDAMAEALRGYAATRPPEMATAGFASFLRWVTAAEKAMTPSGTPFQELWCDATGRSPRLLRWWRALRRRFSSPPSDSTADRVPISPAQDEQPA